MDPVEELCGSQTKIAQGSYNCPARADAPTEVQLFMYPNILLDTLITPAPHRKGPPPFHQPWCEGRIIGVLAGILGYMDNFASVLTSARAGLL